MAAVFPIDWQKMWSKNLLVLREGNVANNLIHQAIFESCKLNCEQIGKILMMMLGSYGHSNEFFLKIAICFGENENWASFIKELSGHKLTPDVILVSETGDVYARDIIVVRLLYEALKDTFTTNSRSGKKNFMSPSCFLYLMERLLLLVSYFNGYFFTSKASVVEWLIFIEWKKNPNVVNHMNLPSDLDEIVYFMADVSLELLLNERDTKEWIRSSEINVEDHFRYLVLRLMVFLCLLCLNFGRHFDVLCALLNKKKIRSQLPQEFCDAIFRTDCYFVDAIADAFSKIGNPLVIVGVEDNLQKFSCMDALFVNIKVESSKEDLMKQLFRDEQDPGNLLNKVQEFGTKYVHPCYTFFWEGFDLLKLEHQEAGNETNTTITFGPKLKVEAEKSCKLLSAAMDFFKKDSYDGNAKLLAVAYNMLNNLMDLSSLLDVREELKSNNSEISQILKRLQLQRPRLEPFFNNILQKYEYECLDLERHKKGL